ncbi:hypothetical protein [Vibrio vulnificus]|uniref:hypothetical protein n=1 Tax=Vibrio vulnificus TaxID=672 RepID=UPI000DACB9AF|nr:hypothetical protein [Vibrio vulnificus]ELP6759761.1 hypothetical protein [Vibrio vulnificus]MDK2622521.1 hypothetical protein [Vibrio vulnificus]RAH25298.1 hypothetical protein DOT36_12380 [Vibrio vulnificus]HDY7722363.1 hypothetical protein [Vibrio vulnificus]HDY7749718.1 hypothetical protein [Vibrio vulnificus]
MLEVYLGISVIVGLVVIYDGYLVIKNSGVIKVGQFSIVTTTIEFLWTIVSIVALFNLEFQNWQRLIPVFYVTHNVLGWAYGVWLVAQNPTEQSGQTTVPMWYAKFGFNFGVVFTLSSLLVQYQMHS